MRSLFILLRFKYVLLRLKILFQGTIAIDRAVAAEAVRS